MTNSIAVFQYSTEEAFYYVLEFTGLTLTDRLFEVKVKDRASNTTRATLTVGSGLTIDSATVISAAASKASMSSWPKGEYTADLVDITGGGSSRVMAVRFVYDDPGNLPYGVRDRKAFINWSPNHAYVTATGAVGPVGPPGPQGETGPQGIQGEQGIQGIQGIQGETGPQGNPGADGADGADGNDGWTPELAVVADVNRRVLQVVDWTGGEGTKPATGLYVGATGLVVAIADAVDIRGDQGPPGSVADGDKVDIEVTSGGTTWTVKARAVSFGKMAAVDSGVMLGRRAAGSGDIQPLPPLEVLAVIGATLQSGSAALVNGKIVESHVSDAVTIALKTLAGTDPSATDPVLVGFTATDGSYYIRTVTAALSLTIPSGATLAAVNGAPFNVYAAMFDDDGTVRLGATQQALLTAVTPLPARGIASSTAVDTAADNAATWYTGTAVTTKAFTVVARMEWNSGLTTAGTWATSPDKIEQFHPGFRLPGQSVDRASGVVTANTTQTAATPIDNTIPAIGEGVELTTAAIPLKSGASRIRGRVTAGLTHNTVNGAVTLHVHRNSTTDAVASALTNIAKAAGDFINGAFSFRHVPGAAGTSTYRLRAGTNTGAFYTGGYSGAPYFNGTFQSVVLEIEEIMG